VVSALMRDTTRSHFPIEDIQDQVELALMRMGELELARGFILYRHERTAARKAQQSTESVKPGLPVVIRGVSQTFSKEKLAASLQAELEGLDVDVAPIVARVEKEIFEGATEVEIEKAARLSARTLIE